MTKTKIAIVGCGFIANMKHLPSLLALIDRCEIVALCDAELNKAIESQKNFGLVDAYITADYRKLIDDPTIDAIHVCTPNNTHREIACAALEVGKNVMCEKPMAISGEDARMMVDVARRTGSKLTVGFQNRFRKDALFVRKAVDEGLLGEIYVGRASAIRRRGVPTWGVFMDKQKQGGGPLIDLGGHALDLTLWYMNNYDVDYVVGVTYDKLRNSPIGNSFGPWVPSKLTVEDSAFGFVKMKNAALVTLDASWALNIAPSLECLTTLCGTDGGAQLNQDGDFYTASLNRVLGGELVDITQVARTTYWGVVGAPESPGGLEAASWLDAIQFDHDPVVLPEQACRVTEILEAIYRSAESNGQVQF